MGKRKRGSDVHKTKNSSSSADTPCSLGTELLSTEKSSRLLESSELKHLSTGMDVMDRSVKLSNLHSYLGRQHQNLGRSPFLKRSRHHYSHQYSRRDSSYHANPSTSHGKTTPLCDNKQYFNLTGEPELDIGHQTENEESTFSRRERCRFSSLATDAVKMVCGICQKLLRRKPQILGGTMSSGEHSVVAVLFCGHVYHADCLEQRTNIEDVSDPPCSLCLGSLSHG